MNIYSCWEKWVKLCNLWEGMGCIIWLLQSVTSLFLVREQWVWRQGTKREEKVDFLSTLDSLSPDCMPPSLFFSDRFSIFWSLLPQPEHKIQSGKGSLSIEMDQVPKVLKPMVQQWAPEGFVVSFKVSSRIESRLLSFTSSKWVFQWRRRLFLTSLLDSISTPSLSARDRPKPPNPKSRRSSRKVWTSSGDRKRSESKEIRSRVRREKDQVIKSNGAARISIHFDLDETERSDERTFQSGIVGWDSKGKEWREGNRGGHSERTLQEAWELDWERETLKEGANLREDALSRTRSEPMYVVLILCRFDESCNPYRGQWVQIEYSRSKVSAQWQTGRFFPASHLNFFLFGKGLKSFWEHSDAPLYRKASLLTSFFYEMERQTRDDQ